MHRPTDARRRAAPRVCRATGHRSRWRATTTTWRWSSYSLTSNVSNASSNPSLSRLESLDSNESSMMLLPVAVDPLALLAEQVGLPVDTVRDRVLEVVNGGGYGNSAEGTTYANGAAGGSGSADRGAPLTQIASEESLKDAARINGGADGRPRLVECRTISSTSFGDI